MYSACVWLEFMCAASTKNRAKITILLLIHVHCHSTGGIHFHYLALFTFKIELCVCVFFQIWYSVFIHYQECWWQQICQTNQYTSNEFERKFLIMQKLQKTYTRRANKMVYLLRETHSFVGAPFIMISLSFLLYIRAMVNVKKKKKINEKVRCIKNIERIEICRFWRHRKPMNLFVLAIWIFSWTTEHGKKSDCSVSNVVIWIAN